MMLQEFYEAIRPMLFEAVMALAFLVLTYIAAWIRRATGVFIEEKHLRTLHSAIRTGTLATMDRGLTREVLAKTVIDYVRASAPDAIKALRPTDDVLTTLITAKAIEKAVGS